MKLIADLHTHTVASSHAYSTIEENCRWAKKRGLLAIAICDHGPAMGGGAHLYHFSNLKCLPEKIEGIRILKGAEANIIGEDGSLDIPNDVLKNLEVVIIAFHDKIRLESQTIEWNTSVMIKALKNPYIKIIGHPENPYFPVDIKKIVKAAKEYNKIIEINNASLTVARSGSEKTLRELIEELKKESVPCIVSSDAHIANRVGEFGESLKLLKKANFPQNLVLNSSWKMLSKVFRLK